MQCGRWQSTEVLGQSQSERTEQFSQAASAVQVRKRLSWAESQPGAIISPRKSQKPRTAIFSHLGRWKLLFFSSGAKSYQACCISPRAYSFRVLYLIIPFIPLEIGSRIAPLSRNSIPGVDFQWKSFCPSHYHLYLHSNQSTHQSLGYQLNGENSSLPLMPGNAVTRNNWAF